MMSRMQRLPRSCLVLLLLAAIGPAAEAAAQSRGAMRTVIRELTSEAHEVRERGRLEIEEPDFAGRYDGEISSDAVQRALIDRQNRDAFVDAYIRWQLTSFDVGLPEMSDREFSRFLQQMPTLIDNPRADSRLMVVFEQTVEHGQLPERQFQQLQQMNDDLDARSREAESLNRPAMQFRDWLREQADAQGNVQRAFELAVEHCQSIILAGWATRAIKTEITARSTAIGEDDSIDRAARDRMRVRLELIRGLEQRFINEVTFMRDRSVSVTFSTGAVRARDIDNWSERLYGNRDNEK